MISGKFVLHSLTMAALMAVAVESQAALTFYGSNATFAAATTALAVDAYTDFFTALSVPFTPGPNIISPLTRTIGSFSYTATANGGFTIFDFGLDPELLARSSAATMVFNGFTGAPSAIGGNFWGNDSAINQTLSTNFVLEVSDSNGGTLSVIVGGNGFSNFVGFTTDSGSITSLSIAAQLPNTAQARVTVDNFTLGANAALLPPAPIPEPETYAMMLAGLGLMGFVARRRKQKEAA